MLHKQTRAMNESQTGDIEYKVEASFRKLISIINLWHIKKYNLFSRNYIGLQPLFVCIVIIPVTIPASGI